MPDILIRIPKRFIDDHAERELPTPIVVRETSSHYFVDPADDAIEELINDAEHYVDGLDEAPRGIVASARATLQAIGAFRNSCAAFGDDFRSPKISIDADRPSRTSKEAAPQSRPCPEEKSASRSE